MKAGIILVLCFALIGAGPATRPARTWEPKAIVPAMPAELRDYIKNPTAGNGFLKDQIQPWLDENIVGQKIQFQANLMWTRTNKETGDIEAAWNTNDYFFIATINPGDVAKLAKLPPKKTVHVSGVVTEIRLERGSGQELAMKGEIKKTSFQ